MPAGTWTRSNSWLADQRHAEYSALTDAAALDAARLLARTEGIIPALESAHAFAGLIERVQSPETAASHPESLIPWRMEQLWRTYLVAQRELIRELETDRIQDLPQSLPAGAEFLKGFRQDVDLYFCTAAALDQLGRSKALHNEYGEMA